MFTFIGHVMECADLLDGTGHKRPVELIVIQEDKTQQSLVLKTPKTETLLGTWTRKNKTARETLWNGKFPTISE